VGSTLMLVGLGGLGEVILQLLARDGCVDRIVVASRSAGRAVPRCNLARLGALIGGQAPQIHFVPLDLNDQERVAEVVRREAPDIVLSTATMMTWWLPDLLPPEESRRLKAAGFGVWLPVHLVLTRKLMEALREADYQGFTITAPLPDVINPVLARLGLAPTCGIGNLDEVVPKVRLLAAERLGVGVAAVRVFLVAHHAFEAILFGRPAEETPPYFLRIEHGGEDVTEAVGGEELLFAPYPLPPGPATHLLSAASAVRLVRALLSPAGALLHAPGPGGLPGGYPVVVGPEGVRPAPIQGLTLEEAVGINERSHRFDGVERIEDDGTVLFCPASAEVMRQTLGYDCPRLHPDEAEARAGELLARFREYAERLGVHLTSVSSATRLRA